MEVSLRGVYIWPGLRAAVKNLCNKHCHTCQMFKKNDRKKYGLLPAKEAECVKSKVGLMLIYGDLQQSETMDRHTKSM